MGFPALLLSLICFLFVTIGAMDRALDSGRVSPRRDSNDVAQLDFFANLAVGSINDEKKT